MTQPKNNNEPIETMDAELPVVPHDIDHSVLQAVVPRLWRPHPMVDAVLALEVIDGPYKGVIFGFGPFSIANYKTDDGLVPVKFTTKLFKAPNDFKKDEAWDAWTSEILLAWLAHVATSNYAYLLKAGTKGIH